MRERVLRRRTPVALSALCVALACSDGTDGTDAPPPPPPQAPPAVAVQTVAFDTATITLRNDVRSVSMTVEVAERPDQRAYGLMDRDELAPEAGMIFLYDQQQAGGGGFWMYRTRIPLDIAFFDGAGRIVAILQMMPCPSFDVAQCPAYSPGTDYFGALEANRGFFARHDIGVGDRIVMPGRIGG